MRMPVCWNGRRGGLKIRCQRWRVGSSPTTGTTSSRTSYRSRRRFLFQSKRHLSFTPSLLLSAKGHARLACPLVNALTTARCRYRPFAGYKVCRYNDHRLAKSIENSIDFAAKRQVWQRMILKIIRHMLIAMSIWQNSRAVLPRSKAARRKAFSLFAII